VEIQYNSAPFGAGDEFAFTKYVAFYQSMKLVTSFFRKLWSVTAVRTLNRHRLNFLYLFWRSGLFKFHNAARAIILLKIFGYQLLLFNLSNFKLNEYEI